MSETETTAGRPGRVVTGEAVVDLVGRAVLVVAKLGDRVVAVPAAVGHGVAVAGLDATLLAGAPRLRAIAPEDESLLFAGEPSDRIQRIEEQLQSLDSQFQPAGTIGPEVELVFESAGFDVLLARSGTEALELFQEHPVDAVVLDYWMPRMKGLSVAREMKQLRPDIPILVLSGFSSLPDETIGIVDTWLQKRDVEPDELLAEVNRLIKKNSTD